MAATVETVTVDLDVTVSSPATFFGFADSKKGEGSVRNQGSAHLNHLQQSIVPALSVPQPSFCL